VRTHDKPLTGNLVAWVGAWRGAGFVTPGWVIRDCMPAGELPPEYGAATLATVAVDPASGVVQRVLVGGSGTPGPPQTVGAIEPGLILIRAQGEGDTVNLIAWRVAIGRFYRVATLDTTASVAVAELSLTR
jgi:hypothetical protein